MDASITDLTKLESNVRDLESESGLKLRTKGSR